LERNTITFPILKKKSGEYATYPLEEMIRDLIVKYVETWGVEGDRLFDITPRAVEIGFKKDCERAGIEPNGRRLRFHLLRHSRVTMLRERGVPLDVISKFLVRHSSISTTASFYVGVTDEMKSAIPKAQDLFKAGG
jgi:integrase